MWSDMVCDNELCPYHEVAQRRNWKGKKFMRVHRLYICKFSEHVRFPLMCGNRPGRVGDVCMTCLAALADDVCAICLRALHGEIRSRVEPHGTLCPTCVQDVCDDPSFWKNTSVVRTKELEEARESLKMYAVDDWGQTLFFLRGKYEEWRRCHDAHASLWRELVERMIAHTDRCDAKTQKCREAIAPLVAAGVRRERALLVYMARVRGKPCSPSEKRWSIAAQVCDLVHELMTGDDSALARRGIRGRPSVHEGCTSADTSTELGNQEPPSKKQRACDSEEENKTA